MDYEEAKKIASEIMERWNVKNKGSDVETLLDDIALTLLRTYKIGQYGIKDSKVVQKQRFSYRKLHRKKPDD